MIEELPSFRKPPVAETALSLQFALIEGFSNAHLGLFWQLLREEFPKVCDADVVANQTELFGDQLRRRPRLPGFRIVAGEAAVRLQMSSADDQTMVQIQNGRVIFNWRRMNDAEYPRWHQVFPKFENALKLFREMLAAQRLKDLEPNQWEVTYVNHLERGRDWNDPSDWPRLVPGIIGATDTLSVGTMESLAFNAHLLLPDNTGRLHVELHHGFKSVDPDSTELLVLQLTARGALGIIEKADVRKNFEIGHNAIVRVFGEMTGADAQSRWERDR